jgi:uncharacterized SAM-binding protein YcdF (DUF218 family)
MHYLTTFSKPTRREIGIAALVAVLALAAVLMYRGLGRWLLVSSPLPPRADVIFTFGGETVRNDYSQQLAEQYPGATWVLSTWNSTLLSRSLHRRAFDTSRVVLKDSLRNTYEEVRYLRSWLDSHWQSLLARDTVVPAPGSADTIAADSVAPARPPATGDLNVLLVSGPYHMRRIKVASVRMLNRKGLHVFYAPVPLDRYPPGSRSFDRWWTQPDLAPLVRLEFVKVLYYLARL